MQVRAEEFCVYNTSVGPQTSPTPGCRHSYETLRKETIVIHTRGVSQAISMTMSLCLKCGFLCIDKVNKGK